MHRLGFAAVLALTVALSVGAVAKTAATKHRVPPADPKLQIIKDCLRRKLSPMDPQAADPFAGL